MFILCRSKFYKSSFFPLLVFCCFAVSFVGAASKALAKDPSGVPTLALEEQSSALCQWYKAGKRGMTVVRIDSQPDIFNPGFSLDYDPEMLKKELDNNSCGDLAPRTSWYMRADALYSIDDYVYPAFLLGVASEVWWVVPSKTAVPAEDFEKFKEWLQSRYGFPDEFIGSLVHGEKVIRGKFRNMPVNITILEDLPSFEQPVLLDVDTDYFTALYVNPVKETMLDLLGSAHLTLREKGLKIDMATISSSGETPTVSVLFHYLNEYLYEIFSNPASFADGPPETWKTQSQVEYLDYMLARDEAVEEAKKLAGMLPDKPWPHFNLAWINAERGNFDEAKKHIEKASSIDGFYARGYISMVSLMYENKQHDEWAALINEAIEKNPNRLELYMKAANGLVSLDRAGEAARLYEGALEIDDKIGFLYFDLAIAQLKSGNRDKALQSMEKYKKYALPGFNRERSLAAWEMILKDLESEKKSAVGEE